MSADEPKVPTNTGEYAVGSQRLPVECSVVSGDVPQEWL